MAAQYPGAIKSFTNPTSSNNLNNPAHATQHADENDEIVAIQTELGLLPKGSYASVKARLDALAPQVGFGVWATATQNTPTVASTDGFIVGYITAGGSTFGVLTIKTDSSTPPTTQRIGLGAVPSGANGNFVCPVKKNDYYLIEHSGSGAAVTAYFISLGS